MRVLVALVILSVLSCAAIAEPLFEKTNIFNAGEGGYALYRIPGIVVTTKGTLLAYCEARHEPLKKGGADWARIDVLVRRSVDGGKTWGPPKVLVTPPNDFPLNSAALEQGLDRPGDVTVNNAAAIVDRLTGSIHFLYCIEYARCYYVRSDDDGVTFTEPVDITETFEAFRPEYDWKVLATGPGHGIQLSAGRLLVPVWLSTGTGGGAHRPSVVSVVYSDDHGRTWRRGEVVVAAPDLRNPSETVAVELADGRVMLNIRHETFIRETRQRLRAVSISPDGVTGWSPVRFDKQLPESVCMASILRLSKRPEQDKNRILFANPHNPQRTERKNLAVKLSYDEGKTWPVMNVIEPGRSGYSDLAVGSDGTIYCFYERGSRGAHHNTAHLCVARFNLEWLTDGRDRFGGG